MTVEIKEILNNDIPIFVIDSDGYTIDITEIIQNIITNLQQNYNKLQDDYQEQYIYDYNLRKQLQQENERLKEHNNDLRKIYKNTYKRLFKNGNDELARYFQAQIDDCPTFYVEPIIDYAKEYKIYKSRCEKADEILIKLDFDNFVYGKTALKDIKKNLQNILNGVDENVY